MSRHDQRRRMARQQGRAEGGSVARAMIGQGSEVPTAEEIAALAQQATNAARFRHCLSRALTEEYRAAFSVAFVRAFAAAAAEETEG
jgi:hypothetical protein